MILALACFEMHPAVESAVRPSPSRRPHAVRKTSGLCFCWTIRSKIDRGPDHPLVIFILLIWRSRYADAVIGQPGCGMMDWELEMPGDN